ncbi:MAG: hypothetical protein KDA58_10410 [Planctomycetaceae bacterium]|nr:hypothetical protein [Planctomycetaceae bacterium]
MRPVSLLRVFVVLIAGAALSGCYQMYGPYGYGSSPYGTYPGGTYPYGGYPGTYQPGIQTLQPGNPYVPGSVAPGTTNPSTFGNGGSLQPIPDNNSNAPGYNGNLGNEVNVPDPYMRPSTSTQFTPSANSIQPASGSAYGEPAPLQPLGGDLREVRQAQPTTTAAADPFGASAAPAPASNPFPGVSPAPAEPANEFFSPVQAEAPNAGIMIPDAQPAAGDAAFGSTASPDVFGSAGSPDVFGSEVRKVDVSGVQYGHGPDFTWLQGVVSKDAAGGWQLTFTDQPTAADQYGGALPLAANPALEQLQNGQFVKVTGAIDPVVTNQQGKPMYVVTQIAGAAQD